ncbi:MAG: hypothetical protein IT549_07450 [Novosphingobium sp.]|nr:hypothetical protein [Novosphingobium sp.]
MAPLARRGRSMKPRSIFYRHYNRLLDLCFWAFVVIKSTLLLQRLGYVQHPLFAAGNPVRLVIGFASLGSYLGLILLMVVWAWRDEYAERLWRQAARSFVFVMLLSPFIWMGGIFVTAKLGVGLDVLRANPGTSLVPHYARFSNPSNSVGIMQFEGINYALTQLLNYIPFVFALLYKWHRWRDGE